MNRNLLDTTAGPALSPGFVTAETRNAGADFAWWANEHGALAVYIESNVNVIRSRLQTAMADALEENIKLSPAAAEFATKIAAYLLTRHLASAFAKVEDLVISVWASKTGGVILAADYPKNSSRLTFRIGLDGESTGTTLIFGDEVVAHPDIPNWPSIAEAYGRLVNPTTT